MKTNAATTAMKSSRFTTFVASLGLLALSSLSGACALQVEADAPDVEVTQHDVAFDGVPSSDLLGDVSTGMTYTQDLPDIDFPEGLTSTVQAVKVDVIAKEGIQNFDFLRLLHVTMRDKAGKRAPIELIDYVKPEGTTVGTTLSIPSGNPINVIEQWKDKNVVFDVQVAGTLPKNAWKVDISVHFSGRAIYKY